MKRRAFIALLGGALAGPASLRPLATRAQQPAMPVIGFLTSLGQNDRPNLREAFRRGFVIPREKLDTVFATAIAECKTRTSRRLVLPPGERFTVDA